ncbi:MAG TPA: hypothetical protein VLJ60_02910, partial [bacterium]|nr:hypothetical protein [bacterium]
MKKIALMIFLTVFVFSCENKEFKTNYDSDSVSRVNENDEDPSFGDIGNENLSPFFKGDFTPYSNPDAGKPEIIVPRTGANDAVISNNVFLQGQRMEVGVSQCGSFGSTVAAPAGYHANTDPTGYGACSSGCYLGFIADPAKDGWNSGTPNFHGDFFLPGSPEEGFGFRINGTSRGNFAKCGTYQINQNVTVSKDYLCDKHISIWEGTRDGMKVRQTTKFHHEGTYFVMEVELTNTTGSTMNNVYYMRNVDPDNEILWTGDYTTRNTIVLQPHTDPEGKKRALVKAEGLIYNTFLGLAAVDDRARVTHGGFSNRNAESIWNGTGLYQTGTRTEDEAISISFKLDNFAPGETKTVKYAYILNATEVDTAFAELTGVLANGVDITDPLFFKICSLTGIDLEIKNHEQYDTWTWDPSTNLNQSTGPNVVFTPPADGSYVFDVTGTNACAETVNYQFTIEIQSGDTVPPEITSCPGNQNSTASALPNYTGLVVAADACASNVRVTQNPPPGTDIGNSIEVTLTVDDFAGNEESCATFTVTYTGPGTPVATAATNVGQNSATANWNVVGNATGYRLDVSNNAGFYSFVTGYE